MPLVRIETSERRSAAEARGIADAIHRAIVDVYGIPERDRFQVLTRHPEGEIIAEDAGLGFDRTDPVVVQIFTQRGRSADMKQRLYRAIGDAAEAAGVAPADLFLGYVENGPEDWTFGFGRAQYLTGELAVPAR